MTALSGITLKQLRSVKAVAQTGSITQAASLLGLTPAVHTQLRGLEAQLGCSIVQKGEKSGMALNERSIDLAIMGRPPREPMVTAQAIGAHPHVMIAAPDNRLAGRDFIEPEEILDEVIISREPGSGTRILMVRYLDRVGEGKPYETIEMGSNETIKQAVMAGLGIALISQHTVTEELKSGRLVAIQTSELPILRQWFVLHRADQALSPAMQTVWEFINDSSGRFFPSLG